jgi:pyrroline-5-carboxylate reductase
MGGTGEMRPESSHRPHFREARIRKPERIEVFNLDTRHLGFDTARMAAKLSIGFLGAGKMATALARGFVQAGLVKPDQVLASDPVEAARSAFANETGAEVTTSNPDLMTFASVVLLAVKPDQVAEVLSEVRVHLTEKHLLISIAAGVPLAKLESGLGGSPRVIRVMPNTPALVGASASAFALGANATAEDGQLARKLFSSVGIAIPVKETLLDAVTGLSGSGPAYACLVIEALSDGGVAEGLAREVATKLAAQTLYGAARMILETGQHPGVLRDMVTSPGGTTIAGLHELEKAGVRGALINAVRAGAAQSRKLGQD